MDHQDIRECERLDQIRGRRQNIGVQFVHQSAFGMERPANSGFLDAVGHEQDGCQEGHYQADGSGLCELGNLRDEYSFD